MHPTGVARRPFIPSLAALVVAFSSRVAHAQSTEQLASRRMLLDQAGEAARAGDHPRALDLARRAETLQATPSLRQFVAEQLAATGQRVAAMGEADLCLREAERDATLQHRERIVASCRTLADTLRRQVAAVTVAVPASLVASAVVHVGARLIDPALLGVPVPADPGTVTIDAEAPGHPRETRTVTLTAGQSLTVTFDLPVLAATAAVPATVATALVSIPLRVHASVSTADIRIDGTLAGIGRVERTVTPGTHTIEASAAGHTAFVTSVEARTGSALDVEAVLPALHATPHATNGWVVPVVVVASVVVVAAAVTTGVVLATQHPSDAHVNLSGDYATVRPVAMEGQ